MQRNVELLRKVANFIEAEPHLYRQETWAVQVIDDPNMEYHTVANGRIYYDTHIGTEPISEDACGTACCVAGTTLVLDQNWGIDDFRTPGADITRRAREALGLTQEEASALFSGSPITAISSWDYSLSREVKAQLMANKLREIANGGHVFDVNLDLPDAALGRNLEAARRDSDPEETLADAALARNLRSAS